MNIVLAVCHAQVRLALALVVNEEPGVTVVGVASEAMGLLALIHTARPDLVLLAWGLPGRTTAAVLAAIQALAHPLRVLVLGGEPDLRQLALQAGAYAFALIGDPPEVQSFHPRWRAPFLSAYAPEDRCHLNGLAHGRWAAQVRDGPGRNRHAGRLLGQLTAAPDAPCGGVAGAPVGRPGPRTPPQTRPG